MLSFFCLFFFFNDTATTEIYTLSLHDALPISIVTATGLFLAWLARPLLAGALTTRPPTTGRSEEHTSELQSPCNLVCRLLLEKKNTKRSLPDIPDRNRTAELGTHTC